MISTLKQHELPNVNCERLKQMTLVLPDTSKKKAAQHNT